MTEKQINGIKEMAAPLKGEAKALYLRGVRDGMDLSMLMADDKGWKLGADAGFQAFLDYLDAEK